MTGSSKTLLGATAAGSIAAAGLALMAFLRQRRRNRVLPLPRLPATASAEAIASALRDYGVVVVERLVPEETMDRLVKDLQETAASGGAFHGKVNSFGGHHTLRNAGKPLGESVAARELAVHPLLLEAVNLMLSPWCQRMVLGTCSAICVEPPPAGEMPAPPQVLHRDENMWGGSSWSWLPLSTNEGRPEFSVSVMWAAADFTEHNGATRFLPGSHCWKRAPRGGAAASYSGGIALPRGIADGKDTIKATMPKGSVVLWSGGTVHGAGAHTVAKQGAIDDDAAVRTARHGLLFIYNLGWLRTEHNMHWAMPSAVMKSFDPQLAELIGMYGENAIKHEWYSGPVYSQPYLGGPNGSLSGQGVHLQVPQLKGAGKAA